MNKIFSRGKLLILIITFIVTGLLSCDSLTNQSVSSETKSALYPNKNIIDGPYIYLADSSVIVKWIEPNKLFAITIFDNDYSLIENNFGFTLDTFLLFNKKKEKADYIKNYNNVDKFVAVSDIHGQYFILDQLLKKYKVIDNQNNWSFGSGHLIIDGDIFDRGDKVTEILWLVYKLKNQAEKSGGKVHYLLGNHELMILNKDLRYMNEKYRSTEKIMNSTYDQLYSDQTIIGQLLRKSPVIVTVNDILFVHGGISPEIIERNLNQEYVNNAFQNRIIDQVDFVIENDSILKFLKGSKGPIWYRGYFYDTTFSEQKLDKILEYFNKNRIVVGHTSYDSISSFFGGKIFGIDASIKKGKNGELFIYEGGKFYRGTLDYGKIELKVEK